MELPERYPSRLVVPDLLVEVLLVGRLVVERVTADLAAVVPDTLRMPLLLPLVVELLVTPLLRLTRLLLEEVPTLLAEEV